MPIWCTKLWKECVYRHFYPETSIVNSIIILTAILFCCCYRHIWQTHVFFIIIFSVRFDGHHPMLILCQTIEFAIVFFSFCIAWLINTWRYTYIKYGWNFRWICCYRHFWQTYVFQIVISWQIIEILPSYVSDRQHLIQKTQSPCCVFLAKRSWIRTNIYYYLIISTQSQIFLRDETEIMWLGLLSSAPFVWQTWR